jgi:hypothetical protein
VVTTAEAWKIIRRDGGEVTDEEIKANQERSLICGCGRLYRGGKKTLRFGPQRNRIAQYAMTLIQVSFGWWGTETKESDHPHGCCALAADTHIDQAPMTDGNRQQNPLQDVANWGGDRRSI